MNSEEFEEFYETLASTLDTVTPDQRALFLMKLALLLAKDSTNAERSVECIKQANQNLSV